MQFDCPDCGHPLNLVLASGRRFWLCPKAIGKVEWDKERFYHYMPEGDPHQRVIQWPEGVLIMRAERLEQAHKHEARKDAA